MGRTFRHGGYEATQADLERWDTFAEMQDLPPVSQAEEHEEFERGAEDMERRALRLEAEHDADMEAYWSNIEAAQGGDL